MKSHFENDPSIPDHLLDINPEVNQALMQNRPVVALESTIITHGMEYPINRDTALAVEKIVRDYGATPATIAIIKGVIKIGLSNEELEILSTEGKKNSRKCSRRDLAYVIARKMNGSTTVAGTMYLASLAGIKVFVTGGIGGVHRGAEQTFDISADLTELARTRISVVSAGVKSILDIPKTLEYLETMGVPVVTYQSDDFPDFFTRKSGLPTVFRCDTPEECAAMIRSQEDLQLNTGILFTVPIPKDKEADSEKIKAGIEQSLKEAEEKGISGALITPFLLKRVNELTGGESSSSSKFQIS